MRTPWIILLLSLALLPVTVMASGKIRGRIVDKATSEPLVGASVSVLGTTLGAAAENGMQQILDGLKEGERIVTSGQFMLDSESQLR